MLQGFLFLKLLLITKLHMESIQLLSKCFILFHKTSQQQSWKQNLGLLVSIFNQLRTHASSLTFCYMSIVLMVLTGCSKSRNTDFWVLNIYKGITILNVTTERIFFYRFGSPLKRPIMPSCQSAFSFLCFSHWCSCWKQQWRKQRTYA